MSEGGSAEHPLELVLVTGMSGAGRSTAAHAMEDLGWFVIDNMPPSLLKSAIDLARTAPDVRRVAVVLDARSGSFFQRINDVLLTMPRDSIDGRLVFLEASDEALVRRFESSRRPHPMQHGNRLLDALQAERVLLGDLRGQADLVIDTTNLNVHDLRRRVEQAFGHDEPIILKATVMSFGFKYGIPVDADFVLDVRFLPNPFWEENLRPLTGLDAPVAGDVLGRPGAMEFIDYAAKLLHVVTEGYIREGKRYVTVAIGCTGGRHRSVAMAEELGRKVRSIGVDTSVIHRDLGRE